MKKILQILKWIWGIIAGLSLLSVIVLPFLYAVLDERLASWIFWIALLSIILYEIIPHKRRIEPKNKFQKVAFGGLPLLLFIFASVFIINYYDTWYNWYWFIFILAIFAVPYGFIALKAWYEDRYETTKEDNKNAILNIFKLTLFYWLADFFYMAWFKNWILWQYIFGGLILLIIFFNLSSAFLANSEKNKTVKWMLLQDFMIGIALTIYLIYIIPEQFTGLQTIVTTIIAAVYGGLLTLVGVAWTIRRQDVMREKQYRSEIKPILILPENSMYNLNEPEDIGDVEKRYKNLNRCEVIFADNDSYIGIVLKNIGKGYCYLARVYLNGNEGYIDNLYYVESQGYLLLEISTQRQFVADSKLLICIRDMDENEYFYEVNIKNVKLDSIYEIKYGE